MARAGVTLQFDWQPMPAILAHEVSKFGIDIRSFREPLMDSIRKVMSPSIRTNFSVGGRPSWEPLAKATEARRSKEGTIGGILVRRSVLSRVAGQLNIWTVDRETAVIDSIPERAWYGIAHQEGYIGGFGAATPARPWAVIQPEDEDAIEDVFWEWLQMRAARVGFIL